MANGDDDHQEPRSPSRPARAATLSFDLAYGIETQWDFLWVQASADGGTTWKTLTNTHTSVHPRSGLDRRHCTASRTTLCAAGLGGFTGYNAAASRLQDTEIFDLSRPTPARASCCASGT